MPPPDGRSLSTLPDSQHGSRSPRGEDCYSSVTPKSAASRGSGGKSPQDQPARDAGSKSSSKRNSLEDYASFPFIRRTLLSPSNSCAMSSSENEQDSRSESHSEISAGSAGPASLRSACVGVSRSAGECGGRRVSQNDENDCGSYSVVDRNRRASDDYAHIALPLVNCGQVYDDDDDDDDSRPGTDTRSNSLASLGKIDEAGSGQLSPGKQTSQAELYAAAFHGSILPLAVSPHRSIRGKSMLGGFRGRSYTSSFSERPNLPPGLTADLDAVARGTVFMKAELLNTEHEGSVSSSMESLDVGASGYSFMEFPAVRTVTVMRMRPDLAMPDIKAF